MPLSDRDAVPRLLSEVAAGDYRDGEPVPVPLEELGWALARMSPEGLDRFSTFLLDLTRRAPLRSPAWEAIREAVEALDGDIRRVLHGS